MLELRSITEGTRSPETSSGIREMLKNKKQGVFYRDAQLLHNIQRTRLHRVLTTFNFEFFYGQIFRIFALLLVSVHKIRELRYARPKIAHLHK